MPTASDVIIWSADVPTAAALSNALNAVHSEAVPLKLIKIDRLGLTRMGLRIVGIVQHLGFKVFADAKLIEVTDKIVDLTLLHLEYQPWMLNIMANSASTGEFMAEDVKEQDALKRFADLCHAAGTLPCAVTVLTSKRSKLVLDEYNGRWPQDQVLTYAEFLVAAGFTDVVCSPWEAQILRADSRFDGLTINTPGVRMPGSDHGTQARVATPSDAIIAGANRLVIGSDLTKGDLATNFRRIAEHLQPVLAA